ncbi:DUF6193 family natural product biosynthesis protein [Streptomyces sp. NPDC020681]|uniref:DUF6193 family natural product biosynthesis protein n=1 Tax=Streptomyces sp. NPDC020681 TaxID=3365083 RepID=UPI0037AB7469
MAAEDQEPARPGASDVLDGDLYPDLIRFGGLAAAMSRIAGSDDVALGEIRTTPGRWGHGRFIAADVATDRGAISVRLGVDRRLFSVSIANDVHAWAEGSTDDLAQVVRMAGAWRGGATLRELHDGFPFMSYTALAQAYEAGDPVTVQWERLLSREIFEKERPLLRAAHAEDRLRVLFPVVSHGSLVLRRDAQDRASEEFWIVPLAGGAFRVRSTKLSGSEREVASMDAAIDCVVSWSVVP